MTRARNEVELEHALASAARIAGSAFGDSAVYLEKWIPGSRHVEVQIVGDGKGNVVHLYERECSLQRRHQKIIEESPSPALDEKKRAELLEAAVAIGRQARYRSAGTCEFLLGEDGNLFFLEVNARIQVEHPVTELVTGRDLVREQIYIARHEALSFSQKEVERRGAAVEARIYAEDAGEDFRPESGDLLRVVFPQAPWIRVDSGIEAGDVVPIHYDPLLAKIIACGSDRTQAWSRLAHALDGTVIHGPVTNLQFLRELVRDDEVRSGRFHTHTIEERILPSRKNAARNEEIFAIAAALTEKSARESGSAHRDEGSSAQGATPSGPFDSLAGWRHPGLERSAP
jgi:acetyl/propionyl-CoA carboxylase alpha subunit